MQNLILGCISEAVLGVLFPVAACDKESGYTVSANAANPGQGWFAVATSENEMIEVPELLRPIEPSTDGDASNGAAISLSLSDLLPDSTGAIVVEGEGADLRVRIVTDEIVVDAGVVEQLVTGTGEDVSGHAYFAFENGTTLYAPRELDLSIVGLDFNIV